MKIIRMFLYLLFFSINLLANETINLLIGEWSPYTSQNNAKGKIAEVIVKESFSLVDIDVVYEYYPWKRSYRNAKEGIGFGTFPWYKSEQREKDFIVTSEYLLETKTVFFHLKSLKFHWENYDDLKKYELGGTIGYTDVAFLKDLGIGVQLVPREELNFKKLLKHRIDLTTSSVIVGKTFINKLFEEKTRKLFTYHPKPLFGNKMYMLISKKVPNAQKLANKFDKGLRQLKESGRYEEIITGFLSQ